MRLDPVPVQLPRGRRLPPGSRGPGAPRARTRPTSDPERERRPAETALEIAIDLRRCGDADLRALVGGLLDEHARPQASTRVPLEPWVAGRQSCIWRFNALYWQALSLWEQATGRDYEQALPGGESDARNSAAVRELILELFKTWDDLDARSALPAELYVVELGVGNGSQARTWLDEFVELSRAHSRDYYRRLHYIMGDYSPHVLGRALKAVAHHGDHVSALVVDATHPAVSLGFLRGKAFLVYISNVYDNLPCDEVARIGGPHLPGRDPGLPARRRGAAGSRGQFSAPPEQVPELADKLLRLGPELLCEALPQHFRDIAQAVTFWREVWAALRLDERYRPLEGPRPVPGHPRPERRAAALAAGVARRHPGARQQRGAEQLRARPSRCCTRSAGCQCHDLFLDDVRRYQTGFFGPGKYDGSVVNWVNGPLLRHIGGRAGFDVTIAPFAQRPSSNVKTLTAAVRE